MRGGLSLFHDQTTNFGANKVPIDVTILILDLFLLQCVYDYHIGTNFIIIPSIQFRGKGGGYAIEREQC